MATHLDLEEQEQLDTLKHFWKRYGSLVLWVLIIGLGGFAAYNGWQSLQRERAAKAAVLYDELDKAARVGDADKAARVFADMTEHYGATAYAVQAGLLTAKIQLDKNQPDAARASLAWVAEHAKDADYQVIAKLRLAGVLLDQKKYDEALQQLPTAAPPAFAALAADRRGDILLEQGKIDDARAAYRSAFDQMDPKLDYRRLVDAKLTALTPAVTPALAASGPAAPDTAAAASAAASGASR